MVVLSLKPALLLISGVFENFEILRVILFYISHIKIFLKMAGRAAGYSSDEEMDFEDFSFNDEIKTQRETFEETQIQACKQRREEENIAPNRLYNAIVSNDTAVTNEILDAGFGIDTNIIENWTPLFLASSQTSPDIVTELLKRGANIKTCRDGTTCLMAACSIHRNKTSVENVVKVVSKLIEHGVDVVATDRRRRTALMFACEQGFLEVVNILLPLSNIKAVDNQGWTALFYAVNNNFPDLVQVLLQNGLDPDDEDIRFNTVKYYAKINDFHIILDLLPKDFEEFISNDDNDNNENNFEEFFEQSDRPIYFSDMEHLLYGMDCAHLIPLFKSKQVDVETFLQADDTYLKEIGVVFSGHRNKIYRNLYRFHKHPWKLTSLPFNTKEDFYSTRNLLETLGNAVKHVIVMRTSVNFILNDYHGPKSDTKANMVKQGLIKCLNRLNKIKITLSRLSTRALMFEKEKPADFIAKDSLNSNMFSRLFNYFPFCYFFKSQ